MQKAGFLVTRLISGSSCSYHHWMIPGATAGGYKAMKLSNGSSDDNVILVKPIPCKSTPCRSIRLYLGLVVRKPVFGVSAKQTQTRLYSHRRWLEISDLDSREILCSENTGADQLRGYREADLRLCFRICKTLMFS